MNTSMSTLRLISIWKKYIIGIKKGKSMNKKGKQNSKLSKEVILRAIKKSMEDQKTLLAKAKRLSAR